jgi:hypothetical protein
MPLSQVKDCPQDIYKAAQRDSVTAMQNAIENLTIMGVSFPDLET